VDRSRSRGKLGLNPLFWDGRLVWQALSLSNLMHAALPELDPWLRTCSSSGDLALKLGPSGLRATGRLGIDELAFADPEQQLALGWKSLAIDLRDATVPLAGGTEPIAVAIDKIALDAPQARYVVPNTAIERLLAATGGAPSEATAQAPPSEPATVTASSPEPRIAIESVELRAGSVEFVDHSGDPYQGTVRELELELRGLKLPEQTVQSVRLRGIAPERAPSICALRSRARAVRRSSSSSGSRSRSSRRTPRARSTFASRRASSRSTPKRSSRRRVRRERSRRSWWPISSPSRAARTRSR
jgi:hypothetical protein